MSTVCEVRTRVVGLLVLLAACSGGGSETPGAATIPLEDESVTPVVEAVDPAPSTTTVPTTTTSAPPSTTTTTMPTTTTTVSPFAQPEWLGTRILEERSDGFGVIEPTPPELQARAFQAEDRLAPPPDDTYAATIGPIPPDVLARSTWQEGCPVDVEDLAYLTIPHWGFDGRLHTGEMIVKASVADDIVWVFEQLHAAAFPIEEMRVIALEELDLPPTGDGNVTTSFVCRPVVTSTTRWSQHAYGLAVDINPFHNPYQKADLVLPELASYYLDRTLDEPGMIIGGDVVTQAFAEIGWGWGGNWRSLDDYMHFSQNGR